MVLKRRVCAGLVVLVVVSAAPALSQDQDADWRFLFQDRFSVTAIAASSITRSGDIARFRVVPHVLDPDLQDTDRFYVATQEANCRRNTLSTVGTEAYDRQSGRLVERIDFMERDGEVMTIVRPAVGGIAQAMIDAACTGRFSEIRYPDIATFFAQQAN